MTLCRLGRYWKRFRFEAYCLLFQQNTVEKRYRAYQRIFGDKHDLLW